MNLDIRIRIQIQTLDMFWNTSARVMDRGIHIDRVTSQFVYIEGFM